LTTLEKEQLKESLPGSRITSHTNGFKKPLKLLKKSKQLKSFDHDTNLSLLFQISGFSLFMRKITIF
jgi:hypothetical protein